MPGDNRWWIMKAADFLKQQPGLVKSRQEDPSTARAEIDGDVESVGHLSVVICQLPSQLARILI
jgi:hypothetical protein